MSPRSPAGSTSWSTPRWGPSAHHFDRSGRDRTVPCGVRDELPSVRGHGRHEGGAAGDARDRRRHPALRNWAFNLHNELAGNGVQAAQVGIGVSIGTGACCRPPGGRRTPRPGRSPAARSATRGGTVLFLEAWQLSEQIIGCLLAMAVDAMSGMITQVRPPRRDEMYAYRRALPLCDPGKRQPNRHAGDAHA